MLSQKDSRFLNLISVITIIGISIGVATLVIALSVLSGFEKTLTQKITDFDSHIQITSYTESLPGSQANLTNLEIKLRDHLDFIAPNVSKLAIISSRKRKEGINIKGIINNKEFERLKSNITEGELDLESANTILIGKVLATKLLVTIGDKVTLFALKNDKIPTLTNLPNIQSFVITGIFESGMAEYDNMIGYTGLNSAQKLFSMENEINGIDIKLKSISEIDSLTNFIKKQLRYPYRARSIFEIHRNIFTWINLQKEPIPIVLGLIILVAIFNIVGALLMLVLEKTNAVGVLKSLGAKSRSVITIFIYQGIYLAIIGILTGNILAFILMFAQEEFNILKVPSSVYFVTKVPLEISGEIFLMVSFSALILAILASIIPSYIASKIEPVKALRFD
jgi:lipoprotein-releasing system permease protein